MTELQNGDESGGWWGVRRGGLGLGEGGGSERAAEGPRGAEPAVSGPRPCQHPGCDSEPASCGTSPLYSLPVHSLTTAWNLCYLKIDFFRSHRTVRSEAALDEVALDQTCSRA